MCKIVGFGAKKARRLGQAGILTVANHQPAKRRCAAGFELKKLEIYLLILRQRPIQETVGTQHFQPIRIPLWSPAFFSRLAGATVLSFSHLKNFSLLERQMNGICTLLR